MKPLLDFYSQTEVRFAWQPYAERTILFREVAGSNASNEWSRIRYDFTWITCQGSNCSVSRVAMVEVNEDGTDNQEFWYSRYPLLYDGPVG